MVLAMFITSIIALTITAVTMGLSASHASSLNSQQANRIATSAVRRIQSEVRKAKLITCAEDDMLAYWTGDDNGDGVINRSEIAVIRYDADNGEVKCIRPTLGHITDETTKTALNVEISLDSLTDSGSVEQVLAESPKLTQTVLASHVDDFRFSVIPEPPISRLVKMYMDIKMDGNSTTLTSASAIRADEIARVGYSDEKYVLTDE